MVKRIRMTEHELRNIIAESVKRVILEAQEEDWYAEEDYDGNTGKPGMVRSYEVGYISEENAESEAEENGMSMEDYLKEWFFEIQSECPWYWEKLGSGYGYQGDTIFCENGVTCKCIYGQIMFDEEPPQVAAYNRDFENRLNQGEFYVK